MAQRFSDQLRTEIERAPMTRYRIAKETGVPASQLSRFVNRQGGLSLESIDKVCELLGVRLTTDRPKRQPAAKRTKKQR